ncbi:hypothetical protein BT67DRAFT_155489 [Trichocladium antarcticum]|uniref:Uncharacterized protein n=1 Tax=Trichocladium antarcticum TaxID=1450529 RepID=A0AAN6UEC2_9PEZI|nr:hypothetical protein BT67DRAFT_155489 [Trichocladium antarcticum]
MTAVLPRRVTVTVTVTIVYLCRKVGSIVDCHASTSGTGNDAVQIPMSMLCNMHGRQGKNGTRQQKLQNRSRAEQQCNVTGPRRDSHSAMSDSRGWHGKTSTRRDLEMRVSRGAHHHQAHQNLKSPPSARPSSTWYNYNPRQNPPGQPLNFRPLPSAPTPTRPQPFNLPPPRVFRCSNRGWW